MICTGALAQTSVATPPAATPIVRSERQPAASAPSAAADVTAAFYDPLDDVLDDLEVEIPRRIWVDTEYLLWWMKGAALPPLVTASPAGTPAAQAGVLGAPTTSILFGGTSVNDDARSGGRLTLGAWLNDCRTFGVEGDFFMLASKTTTFAASSTGSPILARPFIDATTGRPNSELVAFPGLLAGSVFADAGSTGLLGADALLRCNLCCGCNYRLDAVGGYRYLRLSDHLGVAEDLVSTSPSNPNFVPQGTTIDLADRFDTRNEFNGFDFGFKGEFRRGPWVLRGLAQAAVGDNHEVVNISGITTVTVPGFPPVTNVGGLLALPSNIGHFSKDRVAVIPEFGARLGYQLTPHLQAFAGYTFLYWGDVVRAGNEVDPVVNPNLLPPGSGAPATGPRRPMPLLTGSSFWAQGIDLGMELQF
jgi:hypothetical protein